MSNYTCEKCGKEFTQKSQYTRHINKKKSCVMILNNSSLETKLGVDIPKPIVKWVGGKTQIINKLITEFPQEINNYREVFLGGGSVLLTLLSYVLQGKITIHGKIYASDVNESLIYMYKNIQTNPTELYDTILQLITEFNECTDGDIIRKPKTMEEAKMAKENYYYWIRNNYNQLCKEDNTSIQVSAMFIFLNKTCFRGIYRMGPNGFNVPYGNYKNPEIINIEHLTKIHELIQPVIFECCDFTTALANGEPDDFIYLDPPYAPETTTSFVGYTEDGFHLTNHINLFTLINTLTTTQPTKIMMSNADVSLVRENFTNEQYTILSLLCKRSINSKNPGATTNEVIIKNY